MALQQRMCKIRREVSLFVLQVHQDDWFLDARLPRWPSRQ